MAGKQKGPLGLVWALLLVAAGTGVLVKIPEKMEEIAQMPSLAESSFFIRICFYFMAIILIGGGLLKIKKRLVGSEEDRSEKS